MSDLTRDAENILKYLLFIQKGILHPRLTFIDHIIECLRETISQLPERLYFPFRVKEEE